MATEFQEMVGIVSVMEVEGKSRNRSCDERVSAGEIERVPFKDTGVARLVGFLIVREELYNGPTVCMADEIGTHRWWKGRRDEWTDDEEMSC